MKKGEGEGGTYIVRILRTLIDSDERRTPATLCPQPKRLHKFQRIGTVQPPRAIIPTLYRCPAQYTLSDTHPLPLPPRYAPDEVVADFSVEGVRETEHGEDDVAHVGCVHRSRDGWKTVMRGPSMRCEEECISHCKVWKMDIRFGVVNNLATEIGVHDGSGDALILQIRVCGDMETMGFA